MPTPTIHGLAHHYEEVGSGHPFVYIAGTRFDSANALVPYMEKNASGFRVILPDPRGMAGSAHVTTVQPQDWVDDLVELLDEVGIDRVHLAAETFGSRIATRFAADHPDRVRTLILNAVIAHSSPTGDDERRRNSDPANIPPDRRASLELHQGSDWEAVNAFYLAVHAEPTFHQFFDLREVAPRVTAPTLLVRGDVDDPVHPIAHATELHRLIPGSWLAIFPHTEFNALRGRPDDAWALIRRFVSENG